MIYVVVILLGIMIAFYIASYRESNQLHVKKYEIEHEMLTKKTKVLFFSDVHIGKWYDQKHLPMIISMIEMEKPDILICGGDFIDKYPRDKKRIRISEIIHQLQQITVPNKFAVMGNHDYELYMRMIEEGGFQLLKNKQVNVDDVSIIGLEDYLHGRPSLDNIVYDENKMHIVIIHEPDAVDELDKEHVDLYLSGHTHGGQVNIPILRDKVLPRAGKHYLKGKYTLNEKCSIIVSSGIGRTGLPLRLGNPPELVLIQLNPKKSNK